MKNRAIALGVERVLGAFKYLVAILMMVSGFTTALSPLQPMDGRLGYIYGHRESLIAFGVIFFLSGFALFYGKIRRSRKWTGRGLFAIFNCFLFAGILNTLALGFPSTANFVAAVVVGGLWLRWKLKVSYLNPNHFVRDIEQLKE